ncbi:PDR/VanB family oxidoreductase [Nocardioides sp. QY071]|uniref:PDR/VanB family oxidoreductase n=1 Tax=Nocardioides sp. QY071 TaxID=3044187 RepID=UPI00249AA250|nr:PDR/VanB family oxidoreductase [Nocardioides sp. QY071]WGY01692.1 PDR/VanB family oxidoreductase [Nocardioides sp. QY071]
MKLLVRSLRWESDGVVSVELETADGSQLPSWEPGAHIDLALPNGLERQYSLCGVPGEGYWRIAVLREARGRGGSEWIHQSLRVGTTLEANGPLNHFELEEGPSYLFVAGGIGVTPILPMLGALSARGAEWRLLYGGRSGASMAFVSQVSDYGERVQIAPQDEVGLLDLTIIDKTSPETLVYCCGPAPLIDAVAARCAAVGRELRVERFAPAISAEAARQGDGFEVVLERSGLVLEVSDGESILDVVEGAGVWPPSSCLEGTCGTCETKVLAGAVDHRDSILTEGERQTGQTMMICVSRAASRRLVLDL